MLKNANWNYAKEPAKMNKNITNHFIKNLLAKLIGKILLAKLIGKVYILLAKLIGKILLAKLIGKVSILLAK